MRCGVVIVALLFISYDAIVCVEERPMGRASGWSLARQLFALQAAIAGIVLVGLATASWLQLREAERAATAEEMLSISHTLAVSPDVLAGLDDPDPTTVLQPLAERVRADTGTDFVVVM